MLWCNLQLSGTCIRTCSFDFVSILNESLILGYSFSNIFFRMRRRTFGLSASLTASNFTARLVQRGRIFPNKLPFGMRTLYTPSHAEPQHFAPFKSNKTAYSCAFCWISQSEIENISEVTLPQQVFLFLSCRHRAPFQVTWESGAMRPHYLCSGPTESPTDGCSDTRESGCDVILLLELCTSTSECRETCGQCGAKCIDIESASNCQKIKDEGYCSMTSSCKRTCGMCAGMSSLLYN